MIKTITICGSMRYNKQMKDIGWKLECEKGYNVIQCIYNEKNEEISDENLKKMKQSHFKKIDLSDAI